MNKIKRILAVVVAIVITVIIAQAQAPQLMSFQSVVRDSTGKLVTNKSVGLRLSILQGSISGTAVYVETQTTTANANGLVTTQVGGGTVVSGTFSAIDWSAGPYYIKSEIDPTGGTSYLVAGTTQLLSVAYALYANSAGSTSTGSSGGFSNFQVFDSAATYIWTPPAGVTKVMVEAWGGGAGPNTDGNTGGNGGSYGKGIYKVVSGNVYTINVGGGGSLKNFITHAGNSSFDNLMTVAGGDNCCTTSPISISGQGGSSPCTGGSSPNGGSGGVIPGGGAGCTWGGAHGRVIVWW